MYKPPIPSTDITPINLRDNLIVYLGNLPHDLTKIEADKICRVINAHVEQIKQEIE